MGIVTCPKMNTYTAALLACLVYSVSADVTCEECLAFAGKMQEHLMGEDSVDEQVEMLVANGCSQDADPAQCEAYAREYWPKIAQSAFGTFLEAKSICQQLGVCDARNVRDTTCDECKQSMTGKVIEYLVGDNFCGATDHPETCMEVVKKQIPLALPLLGQLLVETSEEHCCMFSLSGACC